ncbi:Scarecrow-like protein 18 [Acorus calamus]|uniref:Scarecrow-like protein 18 n=1 Tax=Acorus calamus TaxID=4465 RepID=A0AAV9EVD4_ACOCL|nr:Scarecrow-like protein 18 [Acorus calamus]
MQTPPPPSPPPPPPTSPPPFEMLTSFNHPNEEDQQQQSHHSDHHFHLPISIISPSPTTTTTSSTHIKHLLLTCADFITRSDFPSASRAISLLSASSSPFGDSTDRLIHHFTTALSLRLQRLTFHTLLRPPPPPPPLSPTLSDAYLTLNHLTPFIRFCHLTANQAILEAVDGHRSIHIVDFDTAHGVQWPPLLQAIAERADPSDPPSIRITGTGSDSETLRRTADRLETFAQSLGRLRFHFQPLILSPTEGSSSSSILNMIDVRPHETVALNCVLHLHRLVRDDPREMWAFLRGVKQKLKPTIVTVAEKEASHNGSTTSFMQRFAEAMDYYGAVFDSLESTVQPGSRERLAVEGVWFGREIEDIVAMDGDGRRERHERFVKWAETLRGAGSTMSR